MIEPPATVDLHSYTSPFGMIGHVDSCTPENCYIRHAVVCNCWDEPCAWAVETFGGSGNPSE